jgi:hypothetical protein
MPDSSDDWGSDCELCEKGKPPEYLAVGDDPVYRFHEDSRELAVNRKFVPEGMLETMARNAQLDDEGITVDIPVPLMGTIRLQRVRSVRYFNPDEMVVEKP